MPCTYQSISLQPGESFVLPPGAILIGATDSGQLSSANDCLDTANLEQRACYFIEISQTDNDAPDDTSNYEEVYLKGIRLNNTFIPFASPISFITEFNTIGILGPDSSLLKAQLINLVGNVFGSWNILRKGTTSYGFTIWYVFQTIPSIVQDLAVVASTGVDAGGSGAGYAGLIFDNLCQPIADFDPGDSNPQIDLAALCSQV